MTSRSTVHGVYGLTVSADFDLHLGRPVELAPGRASDVHFRRGPVIADTTEPPAGAVLLRHELDADTHATFVRTADGGYLLRYAHACDFVVAANGRDVTLHPVEGVDPDFGTVLATGAVLAFLVMLRGHPVLHASAVQLGERALAFVGYSGMGKSTMAALVCGEGGRLVTDDVLRLDVDGEVARCRLGATELRLRKSASELAERFDDQPGRRVTSDQRDALRPGEATDDLLPLAAVVVPQPRRDLDDVEVTRLRGMDALMTLVRYPRLLGLVDQQLHAVQLAGLADVVERVPVFVAAVPWGPPFRPTLAAELLDQLGLDAPQRPTC